MEFIKNIKDNIITGTSSALDKLPIGVEKIKKVKIVKCERDKD